MVLVLVVLVTHPCLYISLSRRPATDPIPSLQVHSRGRPVVVILDSLAQHRKRGSCMNATPKDSVNIFQTTPIVTCVRRHVSVSLLFCCLSHRVSMRSSWTRSSSRVCKVQPLIPRRDVEVLEAIATRELIRTQHIPVFTTYKTYSTCVPISIARVAKQLLCYTVYTT